MQRRHYPVLPLQFWRELKSKQCVFFLCLRGAPPAPPTSRRRSCRVSCGFRCSRYNSTNIQASRSQADCGQLLKNSASPATDVHLKASGLEYWNTAPKKAEYTQNVRIYESPTLLFPHTTDRPMDERTSQQTGQPTDLVEARCPHAEKFVVVCHLRCPPADRNMHSCVYRIKAVLYV